MAIVGRNREINEFNELYDSGEAELVAVYGRRRVGKTFLIDKAGEVSLSRRYAGLSGETSRRHWALKALIQN